MIFESKFQIGKNGLTEGAISSLNQDLRTHNQVRITVLKSAERDKEKIKLIAENITQKVDYYCNYKILGFTIILRRQSNKEKNRKK